MKNGGFGLVEIIVAIGLWVILASSGAVMLLGGLQTNRLADETATASNLAAEGLDGLKAIKKQGWTTPFLGTSCVAGCGLAAVSGTWAYSGTNNVIGKFTRQVFVNPANRDVSGNIVASGGTADADTYLAKSVVTWSPGGLRSNVVSAYTYLTNYVKSILSGGIIVYGDGTTMPKTRDYDRSTDTFSVEKDTVTGASSLTRLLRTSPTKKEAVMGYLTATGTLQIMCFDGSTWSNDWNVTVGGSGTTKRFDIAYETNSGDVIVLYSTNAATTNELAYRIKAGSSGCGAGNWSGATNLDPVRTTGSVQWVKMASDRRSTQNLVTAIWADSNSDLSAMVWSGTAWGNEPAAVTEASLEVVTAAQDVDDFAVEYESLSGDVMMVWARSTGNNGTNGVYYRTCTGGTATCTWGAVTVTPTFKDDATNMDLTANPSTDEIAFASIGNAGSDLQMGYWSGTTWTNRANVDTASGTPLAGTRLVANGWLKNGTTTRIVTVYTDSAGTGISWYVSVPGSAPTLQTDFAATPAMGYPKKWIDIQMDPANPERLMTIISDVNNDLFAKQLTMTATPTFTWSNSDGGAALEINLPQATYHPYSFAYWK